MAYADLTTEQKAELQEWLSVVRPMMGELARINNHFQVAKDAHASHVGDILGELVDADDIPNTSGLSGATAVSKAELGVILTDANAILTTYDTDAKRQMYTKFAGAANLLG